MFNKNLKFKILFLCKVRSFLFLSLIGFYFSIYLLTVNFFQLKIIFLFVNSNLIVLKIKILF